MLLFAAALLCIFSLNVFASSKAGMPSPKRRGVIDDVRDKVEDAIDKTDKDPLQNPTTPMPMAPGETTPEGNNGANGTTQTQEVVTTDTSAVDTTKTTDKTTTSSVTTTNKVEDTAEKTSFNWWGIVIAVVIAAAVVILIIALLPKR